MRISRITGGSAAIGGERAPPIGLSVRRIGVSTVRVRRILWRARLFAYGMQSPIVGRWRWRRWRRLWEGRGRRGVGGGRAGDVSPSTPSRYLLVLNPSAGQANKGRGAVRVDVSTCRPTSFVAVQKKRTLDPFFSFFSTTVHPPPTMSSSTNYQVSFGAFA